MKVESKAIKLAQEIRNFVKCFDKLEQWTIGHQMLRSSVSVASNLSEGKVRTKNEFKNFIRISRGSLEELKTQLKIMEDKFKVKHLLLQCDEIGKMTNGLLLSL